MANDYIPRPDAQFRAWQNNVVTYVNGHLGDSGLAGGAMGPEIRGSVAWAFRPRSCDPPPRNRSVTGTTADFFNSPVVPIYSSCGAGAGAFSSRDSGQVTVAGHAA